MESPPREVSRPHSRPVLLRRARTDDERIQAFRIKVLGKLTVAGCSQNEVRFTADNGSARASVDKKGFLRRLDAQIATGPGNPPIEASMTFDPQPRKPASFVPSGPNVTSWADATAARKIDP